MDNSGPSSSLTPPPEDDDVPAKRRKLEEINSSNPSHSSRASELERICLMRELAACRTRLSNTEANVNELRQMRAEIAEAFAEREEMLAIQAKVERDTIKNLELRLKAATRSTQEDGKTQGIIQGEMSSVKSKMREKIQSLFTGNEELKHGTPSTSSETPTCSKIQENILTSVEIKREQIQEEDMGIQRPEPKQLDIQILECRSVSPGEVIWEKDVTLALSRVNVLEDEFQSTKNMVSSLREAVQDQSLLGETGAVGREELIGGEQGVLVDNCEEPSSGIDASETRVNGASSASGKPGILGLQKGGDTLEQNGEPQRSPIDDNPLKEPQQTYETSMESGSVGKNVQDSVVNEKSSSDIKDLQAQEEKKSSPNHQSNKDGEKFEERSRQNLQLKVGDHHVLVSSPKFFEINWNKYYRKVGNCKFACTKCPFVISRRHVLEDHVWVQHCGGTFKCPYCPEPSHPLLVRTSIMRHMKLSHPDKCSSED